MSEVELLPPIERLAPTTALRTLAPIGVGTGMVESMSSYVGRLAALHRVSTVHLERLVNEQGEALYLDSSTQPFRLDAPTAGAQEFARRLAGLVRQPSVEVLGLGWLQQNWAPPQALKATSAWCSACLVEMPTPYLPLLWSLKTCTACPKHRIALRDACGICGHRQSNRRVSRARLGTCGSCGSGLVYSELSDLPQGSGRPVRSDLSELTLELLDDLQSQPHHAMSRPDVAALIRSAVDRGHIEHGAELARLAGISKGTLHGSAAATKNPTLEVVLRLCAAGKIAPGALFGLRTAGDAASQAVSASVSFIPAARRNQRHDWEAIRRAMFAAMHDLERVPSVAEFAARHEVGVRELQQRLSCMTKGLANLWKRRRAREVEREVAAMAENIRAAAQQLSLSGFRPTSRRIAEMVGARRESKTFRLAMERLTSESSDTSMPSPTGRPMKRSIEPQSGLFTR